MCFLQRTLRSTEHGAFSLFMGEDRGNKLTFTLKGIPWYAPYHCAYKWSLSLVLWSLFGFILTSDTEMSYQKNLKQLLLLDQKMQSAYHQCNQSTWWIMVQWTTIRICWLLFVCFNYRSEKITTWVQYLGPELTFRNQLDCAIHMLNCSVVSDSLQPHGL